MKEQYLYFNDKKFKILFNDDDTMTNYAFAKDGTVFDIVNNCIHKCYIQEYSYYKGKKYKSKKKRIYMSIKFNNKTITVQVARMLLYTYKPIDNLSEMEVDHIDGDPSNNDLDNLEWVTHDENMRRAGEINLIPYGTNHHNSKYSDELIHSICKDICNKMGRKELAMKYHVNLQLIDDIKSGRSHTKISSLYVDKGFKYKKINEKEKKKREKKIRKICKLIDKGYTNSEIVQILELPKNEICLPNDIRKFRIFKYISCDYEFSK